MQKLLSTSAAEVGITTLAEAKRVFLQQAATWWLGKKYHCPVCGVGFIRADDAADHLLRLGHPVLRADAPPFEHATRDSRDRPMVVGGSRTG